MFKLLLYPIVICLTCTGCAVYMSAKKDGVDVSEVQKCTTRMQFLNLGSKILHTERLPDGNLVEIYQVPKERGSAVRAIMHGLLDISTGFTWELFGTPIEATLSRKEVMTIKVTYGPNDVPLKAEFV